MSNISFNFLSKSFLTSDSQESFIRKSLKDIETELDCYRSYLKENRDQLDKECINDNEDSVAISDFGSTNKLPRMDDIIQKSLFLNKFVIDDPLHSYTFKDLDQQNYERQLRGMEPFTEEYAKIILWKKLQYMNSLLPGVNANVGYIKFYPLSKEPTNELKNVIIIPNLSFPAKYPEVFEWFYKNVIVKTVEDGQSVELVEPCKQLAISFQNDNNGVFLPAYLSGEPVGGNKFKFQNVAPTMPIFTQWKNEEIIKSIRDRYIALLRKNEFRIKFGAIVSTDSEFESEFLKSAIITPPATTTETKILKVLTKMQIPSLASTSFEKVMEVRHFFDEAFENFRKQLKDDIIFLQQASDEKELTEFSKSLEAKYESEIKRIQERIKFRFDFSDFNFVPAGIDIVTFLTTTGQIPLLLTGANVLYKFYEGLLKPRSQAKNNQYYFLYKLK